MEPNRVNLGNHKPVYISLTLILLILSAVGIFLLFQIIKTREIISTKNTQQATQSTNFQQEPEPTLIPTVVVSPMATVTAKLTPTTKITPTTKPIATPSAKLTPIPTIKITSVPSVTPTSTNGLINFSSSTDKFSINYSSSRKFYQDTEASGNRYTLTNSAGNFAIHVGLDGKWAWVNSSRNFTNNLLVAGQPTFKYDIATQTIVDLQYDNKNYTIQCIHNGKEVLKDECEEFINNFKLL